MMEKLQEEFFQNLLTILAGASSKCKALDEKFPQDFYEEHPKLIYDSYVEFLKSKVNEKDELVNTDEIPLTTITEKFNNGEYQKSKDPIYRIYHDIKLVCTMLIHYYSQGTRSYQMVDKFYKFASEVILRECYRVGASFVDEVDRASDFEESDFSKTISNDFLKITKVYELPLSEVYHSQTKDGHLFTSIITRSPLDQRPKESPHPECDVTKILPQAHIQPANRLGFIAASTSNVPDPTIPPTEIMTSFLHPNWYPLPTTTWLKYGDYQSFAPSIAEFKSVTDSSRKGDIWLEKLGYKEWFKLNASKDIIKPNSEDHLQKEEENNSSLNKETSEEKSPGIQPTEGDISDTQTINAEDTDIASAEDDAKVKQEKFIDLKVLSSDPKPVNINLKNLYEWSPANKIEDDEIKAFKEGSQQKLLSEVLLKLKELKTKRVKLNKVSKPTHTEVLLYYKAQRILKEAIVTQQVPQTPRLYEKQFPVLQTNYSGSIPVVKTLPTRKKKTKK